MKSIWMHVAALLFIPFAMGAAQAETVDVRLGAEGFTLEVVDDPESRRQGLMGREHLERNEGILFDFPPGTKPAIWMRNMVISLDLMFVDEQQQLVEVFADVPPCEAAPCEIYQVEQPLRFVIEVAAGTAARLGLERGMSLELGDIADRAPPAR